MHAGLNTPDNRLDVGGDEAQQVAARDSHGARGEGRRRRGDPFESRARLRLRGEVAVRDSSAGRGLSLSALRVRVLLGIARARTRRRCRAGRCTARRLQHDRRAAAAGRAGGRWRRVLRSRVRRSCWVRARVRRPSTCRFPRTCRPARCCGVPVRVWRVESMRPNVTEACGCRRRTRRARSRVTGAISSRASDGFARRAGAFRRRPSRVRAQRLVPLPREPVRRCLTVRVFERIAQAAGSTTCRSPESVRMSRRGALTYVFNYGDDAYAHRCSRRRLRDRFVRVGQQDVAVTGDDDLSPTQCNEFHAVTTTTQNQGIRRHA